MIRVSFAFAVFLMLLLNGCGKKEEVAPVQYDGPLQEASNIVMYYNEKSALKMKLTAKKALEFQNGDREFPEGIFMEFFNENGTIRSTLRANEARYFKADDQWRGRGDVEVKNIEKGDQLNSEELFWKADTKRIFTEKFVTIREGEDIIYGTGLEAAQDLSDYTLKNINGDFEVEDNE